MVGVGAAVTAARATEGSEASDAVRRIGREVGIEILRLPTGELRCRG
jgi:hypothetical protein